MFSVYCFVFQHTPTWPLQTYIFIIWLISILDTEDRLLLQMTLLVETIKLFSRLYSRLPCFASIIPYIKDLYIHVLGL